MRLAALGTLLALALYGTSSALLSALVAGVWTAWSGRLSRSSAGVLFVLRLLPTAGAGLVVFGLFVPAFVRYEPWRSQERVGLMVWLAALAALIPLAAGLLRLIRALRRTAAQRALWRRSAQPVDLGAGMPSFRIDEPFPVACVVGLRRHELYVADAVIDALQTEELEAVLAHERRHVRGRDNLQALLLRAAPDWLAFSEPGPSLERAWARAAEAEADARSAEGSRGRALALAAALVRLARLAPSARPEFLPAGLLDDAPVERRVRRLLEGSARPRGDAVRAALVAAGLAAVAGVLYGWTSLHLVHGVTETVLAVLG